MQKTAGHKAERILIHKASPEDAPVLWALQQQLAHCMGEESSADEAALKQMLNEEREPKAQVLIAWDGDRPVGFIFFYAGYDLSSSSYGFHLSDIFVEEAYRSQGLGCRFMQMMAEIAIDEQRQWISLTVLEGNIAAQAFYDKLGFVPVPMKMLAIGRTGLTCWL